MVAMTKKGSFSTLLGSGFKLSCYEIGSRVVLFTRTLGSSSDIHTIEAPFYDVRLNACSCGCAIVKK